MREWHHEFTETAAGIHWRLIEKSGGAVVAEGDAVSRDDAWTASIAALPALAEGALPDSRLGGEAGEEKP